MLRWTLRGLTLAACAAAAYLGWIALGAGADALLGCGGLPQFDCDHVLGSPWSRWFGLPVSIPAAGVYGMMFAATWLLAPRRPVRLRRAGWGVLVLGATLAAGAAAWFIGLMVVTRQFCLWCLAIHACGLLVAMLVFGRVFVVRTFRGHSGQLQGLASLAGTGGSSTEASSRAAMSRPVAWGMVGLGLAAVAALAGGQWFFPPARQEVVEIDVEPGDLPPTEPRPEQPEIPEESVIPAPPQPRIDRVLQLVGGRLTLDMASYPVFGNPNAEHVIVLLSDYTCRHCRTLHGYLDQAHARYGDQMAVVYLPVPMNSRCNRFVQRDHPDHKEACEYARLAAAVWHADQSKFEEFHKWLLEPERPPPYLDAIGRAAELVGRHKLESALADTGIHEWIHRSTGLHAETGRGTIPVILVDRYIVRGEGNSAADLFEFLEGRLGMTPVVP